jgi:hypothetical protein
VAVANALLSIMFSQVVANLATITKNFNLKQLFISKD